MVCKWYNLEALEKNFYARLGKKAGIPSINECKCMLSCPDKICHRSHRMPAFKVEAPFEPTGDQPQAIAQLVEGIATATIVKHF